jgi:type I restriction enzyme S subunit
MMAGTANVTLSEAELAQLQIPLPSLPEQRSVVRLLDRTTALCEQGGRELEEITAELSSVVIAMAHRLDLDPTARESAGWRQVQLSDVIHFALDPKKAFALDSYPNCGIYSFGRGLFSKPPINGAITSAPVLYRVKAGQFIYSRLFAFEGAYGMVTPEFDGCFVSGEYPTFDCDLEQILPEFLAAYFKSPPVWEELASGSRGVGHRRQRVLPDRVLAHRLWLPPMQVQKQIKTVMERLSETARQQSELRKELDSLQASVLDRPFRGEL